MGKTRSKKMVAKGDGGSRMKGIKVFEAFSGNGNVDFSAWLSEEETDE